MEDKSRQQGAKAFRILDALLVVVVLILSTYAFMISGGWKLLGSRSHTQPVAAESEDCPPCEAAKREKEQ
ncbi:MAG: hypothetical protein L3J16_06065, partial [Anaerolineales bacterium]|nr:hypothetical protein [Anaerolineales bacterium]